MTTRRKFIQGAVSAAVAASLPGGDGVVLNSIAHPIHPDVVKYTHKTYAIWNDSAVASKYAEALARSMMQTREMVAVNVFHRGFDPLSLEIVEVDIDDHSKPLSRTLLS